MKIKENVYSSIRPFVCGTQYCRCYVRLPEGNDGDIGCCLSGGRERECAKCRLCQCRDFVYEYCPHVLEDVLSLRYVSCGYGAGRAGEQARGDRELPSLFS